MDPFETHTPLEFEVCEWRTLLGWVERRLSAIFVDLHDCSWSKSMCPGYVASRLRVKLNFFLRKRPFRAGRLATTSFSTRQFNQRGLPPGGKQGARDGREGGVGEAREGGW